MLFIYVFLGKGGWFETFRPGQTWKGERQGSRGRERAPHPQSSDAQQRLRSVESGIRTAGYFSCCWERGTLALATFAGASVGFHPVRFTSFLSEQQVSHILIPRSLERRKLFYVSLCGLENVYCTERFGKSSRTTTSPGVTDFNYRHQSFYRISDFRWEFNFFLFFLSCDRDLWWFSFERRIL